MFRYLSNEFGDSTQFYEKKHRFGVDWYHEAIAKTIIFKFLDRAIAKSDWDEGGGTKAINVAYTIAWLQRKIRSLEKEIDFKEIWRTQDICNEMAIVFEQVAKQMLQALKGAAERREPCRTRHNGLNNCLVGNRSKIKILIST